MNFTYKLKRNLIYNLNNTIDIFNSFRYLEKDNNTTRNNTKKNELKELFIYVAALAAIIIIILGGYALYRKFVEKKLIQEMEQENEIILEQESSSRSNSSKEIIPPYSYNGKKQNNISGITSKNIQNNSFDYNHEERMEKIRKKYGNTMVIKILLNKIIEEVTYNKSFKEDYGDNCTICMNNFCNNMVIYKTPCEHIFHKECFNKYLKNIKKKEKLTCPNCNQNLLINKKFLKLRIKTKKLNIRKTEINKLKESEIDIDDNKELENQITNKNDEKKIDNDKENKDNLIIIKKRKKDEKEFYNFDKNNIKNFKELDIKTININKKKNIYNPINDIDYKNTEIFQNKELEEKKTDIKKGKKNEKDKKIYFDNFENEKIDNKKDSVINLNIEKNKKIHTKKKVNIFVNDNIIPSVSHDINSQRDFINSPTSKKDN